jgi:hypothetical protein
MATLEMQFELPWTEAHGFHVRRYHFACDLSQIIAMSVGPTRTPRYLQPMFAIGRRGTSRSARDVGAIRQIDARRANHSAAAKTCPAPARKIFRLTRRADQRYQLARLTRQGALRTSRHARWDAVDAALAKDERKRSRTAKSCGPGAPTLALSS